MGTPVLIFPADKLQVFESTVKGIKLKQKFISIKMKAKGLENSIRKLCQEFRDVNYEKMNAFLRRTGSTEDTVFHLNRDFEVSLGSKTENGHQKLEKLRLKEKKVRQKLVVHYGGGQIGEDKVRNLEEGLQMFLENSCDISLT